MTELMTEAVESSFLNAEQIERWPAGKVLFNEGEQSRGVFMIHSGDIDLIYSARNGNVKTLRVAHPGELVGLSDAISDSPHDCTASTHSVARIGFIPIDEFRQMLSDTPSLWFKVLQFLSEDINACWNSMRAISTR